jgi:hypothetical protein
LLRAIRQRAQDFCWGWFSDLARVLWPCRVSIAMLLGALILLRTEQGRELIVGVAQTSSSTKLWIIAAQSLWIFLSWFWARLLLDTAFSLDREHQWENGRAFAHRNKKRMRRMISQVPRIIGVFGGLISAEYWYGANADGGNEPLYAIFIALPVFMLAWARDRYNRGKKLPRWLITLFDRLRFEPPENVTPWYKSKKCYTSWRDLPPLALWVVIFSIVLFVIV